MKNIFRTLFFILLLFSINQTFAVPAYRGLSTISLSDGTSIKVYIRGDEALSWYSSEDGYTLLPNDKNLFEYAILDKSGNLVLSGIQAKNIEERDFAATTFLSTLEKGLFFSQEQKDEILSETIPLFKEFPMRKASTKTKSEVEVKKYIAILVEYQDDDFTYTHDEFDSLFNQIGYSANGATGSVRDYFRATSYGKFDLETVVLGPFKLSRNKSYYGGQTYNARRMITEAIDSADKYVDFNDFASKSVPTKIDGVYVIYAGQGQAAGGGPETVWPHRGSINVTKDGIQIRDYACSAEMYTSRGMSGIGTICHESGHLLFGLPDIYDTDYATNGSTPTLGTLEIMDNGSYNNEERTPPLYTSISKYLVGWVDPIILNPGENKEVIVFPSADSNHVFRINTPTAGEYFLIENKQRKGGWDDYMYKTNVSTSPGGLIVLHIDENTPSRWLSNCVNCYSNHPHIRLVHADGKADGSVDASSGNFIYSIMHNDVFPGSANVHFLTDQTTPNTKSWAGANANVPLIDIKLLDNGSISFKTYYSDDSVYVYTRFLERDDLSTDFAILRGAVYTLGREIIEKGFVWGVIENPTIENEMVVNESNRDEFDNIIDIINGGNKYYYRAYARTSKGVYYGNTNSFWSQSSRIRENTILSDSLNVCNGSKSPTMIIGSEPSGGNGSFSYEWLQSDDGILYSLIEGANEKDCPVSNSTASWYRRIAYTADKVDTSEAKYISINLLENTFAGNISVENRIISKGESTGLITLENNVGAVLYWERKVNDMEWVRIMDSENKQSLQETISEDGIYRYQVYVKNGFCEIMSSNTVSILATSENIIISPNPSNGIFSVSFKEHDNLDVTIFNANGKIMHEQKNINNGEIIDISRLESGVYIVSLKKGNKIIESKRIIKLNYKE